MGEIKFGVRLWNQVFPETGQHLPDLKVYKDVTRECEKLGFHSVWMMDHLMLSRKLVEHSVSSGLYDHLHLPKSVMECLVTVTALASITKKIRVGSLVLSVPFRNPSLLAKTLATIDLISNGRLEVGMGAGGDDAEGKAYGIEFLDLTSRIAQVKEAIEVMKSLWQTKKASYQGKYWVLKEAECEPKPIQKPHPPITIAGGSPSIIRVMAEHADRCNFPTVWSMKLQSYQSRLDLLREYCDEVGRDFDDIEKSANFPVLLGRDKKDLTKQISRWKPVNVSMKAYKQACLVGTAEDISNRLSEFANLGVSFFMLKFQDSPDMKSLRLFAEEVMPTLK